MTKFELKRIYYSLFIPLIFIFFTWLLKITELILDTPFSRMGIFPREIYGLPGIVTAPFVHGDMEHLLANTFPLLILSFLIFYFYRKIALKSMGIMYLLTGLLVWIIARPSYHIGASGLIYAFGGFVFTAGFLSRNKALISISFLVTFLYGGMVWGVFPGKPQISWESHLLGAVSGIAIALFFKPDYVVNQRLQGTNKYWTYSNSSYADDNTKFVYNSDDSSEFIVDE